MQDVEETLLAFIAEESGMSPDEFDLQTRLFSEGYIDSFIMTAIIVFIEETFGMSISQSDVTLENFDSVSNMGSYIRSQKA